VQIERENLIRQSFFYTGFQSPEGALGNRSFAQGEANRATSSLRSPLARLVLFTLAALVTCAADEAQADSDPHLKDPRDPFWTEHAPDHFRVRFETSKGPFVIDVQRNWAPHGADRFFNLVRTGFYNDSRFFRVRAGFIAQFGIAGDAVVATRWMNERIEDDPVQQSNTRGFVSYAMTGANTRTTQLFINLADNSRLDAEGFAPIGRVVEGMEIVDALYSGYGEDAGGGMRGGKQQRLFAEGNRYLDSEFPKLDHLVRAAVVSDE